MLGEMNLFAVSSIIIVFTTIFIAVFVLLKDKTSKINRVWAIFCFTIVIWGIGSFKFSTALTEETAFFWWRFAYLGVIFVPVLFYQFVYTFLKLEKRYLKNILIVSYILAFFFQFLNIFLPQYFWPRLRIVFNQFYIPESNVNIIFVIFYVSLYWVLLIFSFLLLLLSYKDSKGVFRNQLKYVIIGSIVGWIGPHGTFFLLFNLVDFYPYSNFGIAIYPIIFSIAIVKYKLWDIETVIHKTMMWLSVSVLLFFPFLVLLFVTRGFLSGFGVVLQFFVYLVLFMFFVRVYNVFQPRIDFFFKRKNHKLAKGADDLVAAFSTIIELKDLIIVLEVGVKNLFFARDAKVFLKEGDVYVSGGLSVRADCGFVGYMEESGEVIEKDLVLVDLRYNRIRASASGWFDKNDFVLLVPVVMKGVMSCFLALGKRDNLQPYSDFHIGVLQKVLRSFAVSLNNAFEHKRLIDVEKARKEEFERYNVKLAKEKSNVEGLLRQKTRFINQLSHDLKTPLTPLLNLLPALGGDIGEGERKELVSICIKNSKYLENLIYDTLKIGEMENMRYELNLEKTNLFNFLKNIILVYKKVMPKVKIINNVNKNISLFIDANKMREVFENIINNAVKYNESEDKELVVSSKKKGGFMAISFKDNGIGIAKKDLKNVFEEFYKIDPSRHSLDSSGLGLSIVKRIMDMHKGKVRVESKGKNQGTTITVKIPVKL